MISIRKTLILAGLAGGLLLGAGTSAQAEFRAVWTGVTPEGPHFRHTYDLIFESSNGTFELRNDDFLTIYDVGGPASLISVDAPAGFDHSTQFVGIDAFGQSPPTDSPTSLNVTFTRNGGTVSTSQTFVASIVSVFGATRDDGLFTSQWRTSATGARNGRIGEQLLVPVPEPVSMTLLGLGGLAAIGMFRRRAIKARAD